MMTNENRQTNESWSTSHARKAQTINEQSAAAKTKSSNKTQILKVKTNRSLTAIHEIPHREQLQTRSPALARLRTAENQQEPRHFNKRKRRYIKRLMPAELHWRCTAGA